MHKLHGILFYWSKRTAITSDVSNAITEGRRKLRFAREFRRDPAVGPHNSWPLWRKIYFDTNRCCLNLAVQKSMKYWVIATLNFATGWTVCWSTQPVRVSSTVTYLLLRTLTTRHKVPCSSIGWLPSHKDFGQHIGRPSTRCHLGLDTFIIWLLASSSGAKDHLHAAFFTRTASRGWLTTGCWYLILS